MALTQAEQERVVQLLDNLDYYERQRTLSSQRAFEKWLRNDVAHHISLKVIDLLIEELFYWLLDCY
jgi:hypothetical protein